MFKKDQRVLYMAHAVWHIATVVKDQIKDDDRVVIQPHGMDLIHDLEWLPFDAPVERVVLVDKSCQTIEQAVLWLRVAGNWK